jgi:hypothetical protein
MGPPSDAMVFAANGWTAAELRIVSDVLARRLQCTYRHHTIDAQKSGKQGDHDEILSLRMYAFAFGVSEGECEVTVVHRPVCRQDAKWASGRKVSPA